MTNTIQANEVLKNIRELFSQKKYSLVKDTINKNSFLCDDINNSQYWTVTQGLYLLALEELNKNNQELTND
jgi:hypothetical protein